MLKYIIVWMQILHIFGDWLHQNCDKEAYVYIYERNRKYENASKILTGFKGYVHLDGYDAYKRLPDAINVG